mgnify:CR=1 FL=1|tara:strand:+ start:2325 stop:2867 length:543 start_codon:yes stop_codon:yes gene_type:complete
MIKYDCIFFDRDGTVNHDPGYISKLEHFKFFEFSIKAMILLANITDKFIMVTNQSGVSRGLIDEADLLHINDFIMRELTNNKIPLIKIYYCTDHPDFASERRKPGTGMFLEASKDFDLNLGNCLMIGDSKSDIEPANTLGMDSMLVLTGNGARDQHNILVNKNPNYITENILTGAKLLNK